MKRLKILFFLFTQVLGIVSIANTEIPNEVGNKSQSVIGNVKLNSSSSPAPLHLQALDADVDTEAGALDLSMWQIDGESSASLTDLDWTWSLRGQVNWDVEQKPTARDGVHPYNWGSLRFTQGGAWRESPFEYLLAGQLGPERQSTTEDPRFMWDELRWTYRHRPSFSVGVLHDPVLEFLRQEGGVSLWSLEARPALEKWGYVPYSDVGIRGGHETEHGHWVLQVTNGEGFPKSELGPRKDLSLSLQDERVFESLRAKFQLAYRQGGYDSLGKDNNLKKRWGLSAAVHSATWTAGISGFSLEDSADGIHAKNAEGIDLSAKGGQIVRGQVWDSWFQCRFGERKNNWNITLRSAQISPDQSEPKLRVQSNWLAVMKTWAPGVQMALGFEQVDPTREISNSAEDRQKWFMSWVFSVAGKNNSSGN